MCSSTFFETTIFKTNIPRGYSLNYKWSDKLIETSKMK